MKRLPPYQRTRIAPTPSGLLHLGNAFSFAITAGLARLSGARILLRIDDMDQQRVREAYIRDIFESLHFLDIPWDEGPSDYSSFLKEYSQQQRLPLYQQMLERLWDEGKVFGCRCSRSELAQQEQQGYNGHCLYSGISKEAPETAWRLDTRREIALTLSNPFQYSKDLTLPASMQHFIIRKKDGLPAYQLCSLADDFYFNVDLIIRGADLMDSSLAQLYLADTLQLDSFKQNSFLHHPLLLSGEGLKLSKSLGAGSLESMRKSGKTTRDIYSMISMEAGFPFVASNYMELTQLYLQNASASTEE
jgi:glutamyl-tRNA synthetase